MARGISLSAEPGPAAPRRGIPLRWMLVLTLSAVIVCLTTVSLRIVDARLHQQMGDASRVELRRSLSSLANAESERVLELQRENALLADLPSLKALMTSADDRTIQDAGQQ